MLRTLSLVQEERDSLDTEIRPPFLFLSEMKVVLYLRNIAYSMVSQSCSFSCTMYNQCMNAFQPRPVSDVRNTNFVLF